MVTKSKRNPHDGSTLEDWLREEGIVDEVKAEGRRRIKRWQLEKNMKKKGEAGKALPQKVRRKAQPVQHRRVDP
jgi:hypothetical protein